MLFLPFSRDLQLTKVKSEIGEMTKDPQQFLLESLHLAGYSGALGNPLMAPEAALKRINGSIIGKFYYVSLFRASLKLDKLIFETAIPKQLYRCDHVYK